MRTIKFRGKEIETNQRVYGDLLQCPNKYPTIRMWEEAYPIARSIDFVVFPESVGQFTGLHYKNGKEIYEGDIICSEKYKHIHVISYDDTLGSFVGKTPGDRYGTFTGPINQRWINDYEKEVIGNIHTNPELMKGGEE